MTPDELTMLVSGIALGAHSMLVVQAVQMRLDDRRDARRLAEARKREETEARIRAVRELHWPDQGEIYAAACAGIPPACAACRHDYPCPTVNALDLPVPQLAPEHARDGGHLPKEGA